MPSAHLLVPCTFVCITLAMLPDHPLPGRQMDVWRCGAHGACNAILPLNWAALRSGRHSSSAANMQLGPESRGGSSAGGTLAGMPPPATVPEESSGERPCGSWQLLTGHDNGQVLVWDVARDILAPVCELGEVGSPVRAVASLDSWGLICTAHANGELALFARAAHAADWGGASSGGSAANAGGGSGGGGSSCPGSAGAPRLSTTSVGIACIRPRRVVLRAHRTPITAAGACASGIVTASSQGTLRLWRAAQLAREADRGGLQLSTARRTATCAMSGPSWDR